MEMEIDRWAGAGSKIRDSLQKDFLEKENKTIREVR
jgi:hypothetical protein